MQKVLKKIETEQIQLMLDMERGVIGMQGYEYVNRIMQSIAETILAEQKEPYKIPTKPIDKELITGVKSIKTKGDVIRESNESLATEFEHMGYCSHCIAKDVSEGCNNKCKDNILKFLNQPYKEGNDA